MPSSFELTIIGSLDTVYQSLGVPAEYTPPNNGADQTTSDDGGGPLLVRILKSGTHNGVHLGQREVSLPNGKVAEVHAGYLLVQHTAMNKQKPQKGGRFFVDGIEVWDIEMNPFLQTGEWNCAVIRKGVERLNMRRAKE